MNPSTIYDSVARYQYQRGTSCDYLNNLNKPFVWLTLFNMVILCTSMIVQCEWIVERKPENKPLQNHICCQKRDYLFTKTTSQSFPTKSFTGEIGFQTTRRVEEEVRMIRKLSHHSGPRRQKITRSKLIRWSMRWVEMRTRFWKVFISQKGH